ncbi:MULTISPECIES: hypothetical protein [unclassified Corynebacterium]|uniref:hypothetical protein n=1 Tax=unclassified Corynebacterium TaxID=2624378 RepID=UPI0034D01E0A
MDMRAEVWSPLQNTAVWLGAWLYHRESADATLQALEELGGPVYVRHGEPGIELLRLIRDNAADDSELSPGARPEPALRLILSGPGDPPALPAGTEAAEHVAANGAGGIVVRTADPDRHVVLAPEFHDGATWWFAYEVAGRLPEPAWLSPGEANAVLSAATEESAQLIEASGQRKINAADARLTVGTLADFYDTPGLPSCVPGRAAKLFARADRVAAIIETVTDRLGDHSLDPQLLRLWRHIRQARMAGVAYALSDFAR